jgi:ComF family protein
MRGDPPPEALAPRLLDLIFPPRCVGCGARGAIFCPACRDGIRRPVTQICARCERPLPAAPDGAVPDGLCARCRAPGADLGPLAGICVAARYEGPLRQAILALKYQGQRRLSGPLGDLMASAARAIAPQLALIVPVPLHASRVRQRGYNQAELLARRCGSRLGMPVRADLLARTRATPPQVGLDADARRINVAGAFAAGSRARAALAGCDILLLDDVCTTGATLASAAAALLDAGARSVWGLAVARPALGADGRPARGGAPADSTAPRAARP